MYAVLGFLTHGPHSGYDLKKAIERSTGNFWQESYGQIYPILRKLHAQGLVDKRKASSSAARQRFEYTITKGGKRALRAWLKEPLRPSPVRNELLLKIFFGSGASKAVIKRHVLASRDRQVELLERYRGIQEQLTREHGDSKDLDYWLLTARYGELLCQARLVWAEEALRVVTK